MFRIVASTSNGSADDPISASINALDPLRYSNVRSGGAIGASDAPIELSHHRPPLVDHRLAAGRNAKDNGR
jgi:hypothetical protein